MNNTNKYSVHYYDCYGFHAEIEKNGKLARDLPSVKSPFDDKARNKGQTKDYKTYIGSEASKIYVLRDRIPFVLDAFQGPFSDFSFGYLSTKSSLN